MSSLDEYKLTRYLPRTFLMDGRIPFHRTPLIEIGDGVTFTTWLSEDGNYKVVYGQTAAPGDPRDRALMLFRRPDAPTKDDAFELMDTFMPDTHARASGFQVERDNETLFGFAICTTDLLKHRVPGFN